MKKAVIIIVFFLSLFIGKEAIADIEGNELIYNVSPDGSVDFSGSWVNNCYELFPNYMIGLEVYKGSYPEKNDRRFITTSGQTCGHFDYGYMKLENTWGHGGITTEDGSYWVRFASGGQMYSYLDWGQPWYYIEATRTNGLWSGGNTGMPEVSSITPSYPVNTTIQPPENLNQTIRLPVTLTGSYTNIDEYNYILVYGLDEGVLGREYVLCESDIGESGNYSCSVDFWTNKTYNYEMIMTKTPAPSSPSVSSGVKSFSIGEPFISSNDFLTSDEEECEGYTDIYCHLKNAFRWGFIPSKATFYKFVSLSNKIMERAPFGYAKIIYQKLENLQIDETNNLELVSLSAIDNMIYTPFRVAFSYILYFVFVVGLYFRFRNINI